MKTINLNSNSWHYWLATTIASFKPDSGDFCSYVRNVAGGALLFTVFSMCVGALGAMLLTGIGTGLVYLWGFLSGHGFHTTNTWLLFSGLFTLVISTIAAFIFLWTYIKNIRDERLANAPPKPDSFLKAAWKSFKDKVCFKVNFNNGDE